MDISIPIIDGWEATQVLKHDPDTRHIPIIALTAHALASDREKAMEVGCDSYLAKPCEPKAVVSEVQRFLGKRDGHVRRPRPRASLSSTITRTTSRSSARVSKRAAIRSKAPRTAPRRSSGYGSHRPT